MYHIEYLPSALLDLTEISAYIGVKLQNPSAADNFAENIIKAVDDLSEMPYKFSTYTPIKPVKHEYRKIIVKNYLIFYWIDEDKKLVSVARVVYGRRNVEEVLD